MKTTKIYVVYVIHEQLFDILTAFTDYRKAKEHVKTLSKNPLQGRVYAMAEISLKEGE